MWGNHFTARVAPAAINQWLSGYFQRDVQLRWLGSALSRRVKKHPEVPLSFADGYPFLLINEASFRDLQQRCPAGVKLEQFRPNLVVTGAAPWAEDGWQVIRVGEVMFDLGQTVQPLRADHRQHRTRTQTPERRAADDAAKLPHGG
ncbi:Uncharacterized Fe-S protein [Serratia rubidaea]|uniref:Uncharacterized Fe-S protein n=1 Tax=Serratia rubidaea TaxID=61652 RepID=A0A3S4JUV4_SERRU|nr:Uncharacterized Fe-S protein [Serratia rubidaea]